MLNPGQALEPDRRRQPSEVTVWAVDGVEVRERRRRRVKREAGMSDIVR